MVNVILGIEVILVMNNQIILLQDIYPIQIYTQYILNLIGIYVRCTKIGAYASC